MVEARALAVGEGNVVDAALAVGPGGPQTAGCLVFRVFGHPEAKLVVEGNGSIDVRREAVEVVDAERLHALVERVFLMDRRQAVHLGVELQRNAVRIAGPECARLIGPLDPVDRQPLALEEVRGLVEVFLVEHLEAEITGSGICRFAQDKAMVAAFFHGAQIDRLIGFVRDLKPERVDIEGPALGQIRDAQFHMAEPDDVEGRIEIGGRNGHGRLLR